MYMFPFGDGQRRKSNFGSSQDAGPRMEITNFGGGGGVGGQKCQPLRIAHVHLQPVDSLIRHLGTLRKNNASNSPNQLSQLGSPI